MGEREENDEEVDGGKGDEEVVRRENGDGLRPFILPLIWTVNDFYLTMSPNVFNKLRDRFQIPDNIPIRLPRKFKKCYSGKTAGVGMYDVICCVSEVVDDEATLSTSQLSWVISQLDSS